MHLRTGHVINDLKDWKRLVRCAKAIQMWDKFYPITYVAADQWRGIEYSMEVLGEENVRYLPGPKDRNSCSAVVNSFVEIFMLSRTADAFVLHGSSTFARFVDTYGELVGFMPRCNAKRPGMGQSVPNYADILLQDITPE